MACSNTPTYLHYNSTEKKLYKSSHFQWFHRLYRTGFKNIPDKVNPIEFPDKSTSISVCWSKLICQKDVLNTVRNEAENPDAVGNHVYFGIKYKILKLKLEHSNTNNGLYKGLHIISPIIKHSPNECNYSHSEILIQHTYPYGSVIKTEILTEENWDKSLFKKFKKGHMEKAFFRQLNLEYRTDMSFLLNNDIDETFASKYIPKKVQKAFILLYSYFLIKNH